MTCLSPNCFLLVSDLLFRAFLLVFNSLPAPHSFSFVPRQRLLRTRQGCCFLPCAFFPAPLLVSLCCVCSYVLLARREEDKGKTTCCYQTHACLENYSLDVECGETGRKSAYQPSWALAFDTTWYCARHTTRGGSCTRNGRVKKEKSLHVDAFSLQKLFHTHTRRVLRACCSHSSQVRSMPLRMLEGRFASE
jgi:hypothetical protein